MTTPATPLSPTELVADLKARYPGIEIQLLGNGKEVELTRLIVPQPGTGVGTATMQRLVAWADAARITLTLDPTTDYGSSRARLSSFFQRFGFVANKGRTQDFAISRDMYRHPARSSEPANMASARAARAKHRPPA